MAAIPVRMLNEIQYCERLFHLMHVQGLFEDNADTIEGTAQHEKAFQRMRKRQMAPEDLWKEAPLSLHLGECSVKIRYISLKTAEIDPYGVFLRYIEAISNKTS